MATAFAILVIGLCVCSLFWVMGLATPRNNDDNEWIKFWK